MQAAGLNLGDYCVECVKQLESSRKTAVDSRDLTAVKEQASCVASVLNESRQALGAAYAALAARVEAVAQSVANADEKAIQDTFYTKMITIAAFTDEGKALDLRQDAVKVFLTAKTIIMALRESRGVEGIRLDNGKLLTLANCPPSYQRLAAGLLELKPHVVSLSPEAERILDANIHHYRPDQRWLV